MVELPPALDECEALDWSKTPALEWAWENKFLSGSSSAAGVSFSHTQRVLMSAAAVYYSNESVREKGDMKLPEQNVHAAECMRSTAAPGAILFFRDTCGFVLPAGLENPAELGKTAKEGNGNCCTAVFVKSSP